MNHIRKYWIPIMALFIYAMFKEPAACFIIIGGVTVYKSFSGFIFLRKIKIRGIQSKGMEIGYSKVKEDAQIPVIEFITQSNESIKGNPYLSIPDSGLTEDVPYKSKDFKLTSILYLLEDPYQFIEEHEINSGYLWAVIATVFGVAALTFGTLEFSGITNIIDFHYGGLD